MPPTMSAEPGSRAPGAATEGSPGSPGAGSSLGLSLVSHTNVGKTTLARTLLRRDIGDVLDQAHVTLENLRHVMVEGPGGERLELWDTPGFGDSARFVALLRGHADPVEWALAQTFDPDLDRPLWCSQAALRNVREEGDLVLYLVNASEHPADAGYVEPEMELLEWLGKPVLLILNQTGPPREPELERADEDRWLRHLERWPLVRGALQLDAFARCWVQEGVLLERARDLLPEGRRALCERLLAAWRARQLEVFRDSRLLLAQELARAALDAEAIEEGGWGNDRKKAMGLLKQRMVEGVASTVSRLIALHGLEGRAAIELETATLDFSHSARDLDPRKSSALGGVAMGLGGGLWADLATGGLSFGSGAILGGLLGAAGGFAVARAFKVVRGPERPRVQWSEALLERTARELALRYLAVAHHGRGRGAWRDREPPRHWRVLIERALQSRRALLVSAFGAAHRPEPDRARVSAQLEDVLGEALREVLASLYPSCAPWLA